MSSISSKHREYLDNLRMVASGIFEYFNFVTPFTKVLKKSIKFFGLCQAFPDATEMISFDSLSKQILFQKEEPYPRLEIGLIS